MISRKESPRKYSSQWIQWNKRKIFRKTLKRKNLENIKKETDDKFKILKKEDLQNVNQDTNNGINLDKKDISTEEKCAK